MANFLNTSKAVEMYATLAAKYNGDVAKFSNQWKDILEQHGEVITEDVNEEDILPKKIVDKIHDAIQDNKVFAEFHPIFNAEVGEVPIEQTDNTSTQSGHKRNANKLEQQVNLTSRMIFPKAIYKLMKLDHMTYLKGGALVEWVLSELPRRVVNLVARAILKGGITNEDGTPFTAVKPIIGDELATKTTLASGYTAADLQKAVLTDVAKLNGEAPTIFMSPSAWATLALAGDAWSVAMLSDALNLGGKIVRTPLLDDTNPYVVVDTRGYVLAFAGSGVETLADFIITSNSEAIESRAYVAGALATPQAAAYAVVSGSSSAE